MKINSSKTFFKTQRYGAQQPEYRLEVDASESEYLALVKLSTMFEGGAIDIKQLIWHFETSYIVEQTIPVNEEDEEIEETSLSDLREGAMWERKRIEIAWQIEMDDCGCEEPMQHLKRRIEGTE